MEQYLLGIDIGTSGCKLLVYDLEGHVIFRSSRKYREEGRDGFRELNPEVVLENVKIILSEAGKNCPENIEALPVLANQLYVLMRIIIFWPIRCLPETVGESQKFRN